MNVQKVGAKIHYMSWENFPRRWCFDQTIDSWYNYFPWIGDISGSSPVPRKWLWFPIQVHLWWSIRSTDCRAETKHSSTKLHIGCEISTPKTHKRNLALRIYKAWGTTSIRMVPNRLAVVKATCWIGSGWLSLQYVPKPLLWWVTVMYLGCCFSSVDKIWLKKSPKLGHLLLFYWGKFTFSRVRKAVWKHPHRFDFFESQESKSIKKIQVL